MKAQNELPLDTIQVQIGDLLDRETLMHGSYDFESGFYRRWLLEECIRRYRAYAIKNGLPGPICLGHKRAIRAYMHVIDTAYEVRVSGIEFVSSQCEGGVANQCYIGAGGLGFSGCSVRCKVIFLAELEDQYQNTGTINHVAINVTSVRWPQHRILAARAAMTKRLAA